MNVARKSFGLCCLLLCLVAVGNGRAEEFKLAVIDVARVVRAYPETSSAEAILIKQKNEFEAEHEKMIGRGEKLKAEFEELRMQAESKALSEEARREKVTEARALMQQLVELERDVRENSRQRKRELADEEARLMGRIYEQISKKVEEYVEQNKFTLVLNSAALGISGTSVVVYSSEHIDITADIIKLTGGIEKEESGTE